MAKRRRVLELVVFQRHVVAPGDLEQRRVGAAFQRHPVRVGAVEGEAPQREALVGGGDDRARVGGRGLERDLARGRRRDDMAVTYVQYAGDHVDASRDDDVQARVQQRVDASGTVRVHDERLARQEALGCGGWLISRCGDDEGDGCRGAGTKKGSSIHALNSTRSRLRTQEPGGNGGSWGPLPSPGATDDGTQLGINSSASSARGS